MANRKKMVSSDEPNVTSLAEIDVGDAYRRVLWTGNFLQTTTMTIKRGHDVGLEVHRDTDQILIVQKGKALVLMGRTKHDITLEQEATKGSAIHVPAGTWHNVVNDGTTKLKLLSIYAPPHHRRGFVQNDSSDDDNGSDSQE